MTFGAPEEFFKIMPKEKVYSKTGIQIMNFNSLFQLFTQKKRNSSIYDIIDKVLFIPDALSYLLTGKMVTEYTIASTSQMIIPFNKTFDTSLLEVVGLTKDNFAPIVLSGTVIGELSESVKQQTNLDNISVYESLAFRYKQVLENLQKLAHYPIETLHIIGGGSKNSLLNSYTANAIGLTVVAGPSEATAMGNILLQAKATRLVKDKNEMRKIVRN